MSTALALARYLLRLHQSCSWLQLSAAAVRRFMCTGAALRLEEPLPYFPVLPLRGAITRHQFYLRLRSVFNPAAVLNLGVCKRQNRKKKVLQCKCDLLCKGYLPTLCYLPILCCTLLAFCTMPERSGVSLDGAGSSPSTPTAANHNAAHRSQR